MSFIIRVRVAPDNKITYYAISDAPEDIKLGRTMRLVTDKDEAYRFPSREAAQNVIGHHHRVPFDLSEVINGD